MRLAKDLLGHTSDVLRLLARANHFELGRWQFVTTPRLPVYRERLFKYTVMLQVVWLGFCLTWNTSARQACHVCRRSAPLS